MHAVFGPCWVAHLSLAAPCPQYACTRCPHQVEPLHKFVHCPGERRGDCQCVRVMFLHTQHTHTHMYFLSTLECCKLWLAVLHDNYPGFCMVHDHCNAVIVAAGDYHQRWQGKEDHARHLRGEPARVS